jgi:hypothetical protein
LRLSFALGIFLLTATAGGAGTFSANTDFGSSNPSGAWSYGRTGLGDIGTLDSSFIHLTTYTAGCISMLDCWHDGASIVKPQATFTSGTVQYQLGYLNLHPDSDLDWAVLAFTAPSAGSYTFTGQYVDHDVAGGGGVVLAALLGDGTYFLNSTQGADFSASQVAINFAQSLSLGQRVYFAVGANGEWTFDSVGLSLTAQSKDGPGEVPEPGTMVLLLSSGALLWFKRRFRATS